MTSAVAVHAELTVDRQRIVVLASGQSEQLAYAARQLEQVTPLVKKSDPPGALVMPASWPAVVQLRNIYGPAYVPAERLREWTAAQAIDRTRPLPGGLSCPVPDGKVPRGYQVAGALEIARTGRALIMDEPRTGKTVTTILGLAELLARWEARSEADKNAETAPLPILVVCPAAVVDPWIDLFTAWAPYWRTVAWRGPRRAGLAGTADVYVCSYETAVRDAKNTKPSQSPLVALDPRALVVDEFHRIKNPKTARTRAVLRLARNVQAFVGTSGTPITHHSANAWPALTILAPGAWPSRERWVARYCLEGVQVDYGESILGLNPGTEDEWRVAVAGQLRRVARADVLDQLPAKQYSVRTVDLPTEYRKAYDSFEADLRADLPGLDGADGVELSVMDALSQLQFLSRLACAAADVEVTFGPDEDKMTGLPKRHVSLNLRAPSWKVDALVELLAERRDEVNAPLGHRSEQTVAFSVSSQLAMIAGAAAAADGHRVGYIIGGQTPKQRTSTIAAFQAGDLDLIAATTSAGSEGITLSSAGTIAFLQRPWSIVESLQAEDRGEGDPNKTRGTEIVDIVATNTIDTRVRAVLRERAGQLSDFLQDPRIVTQLLGGTTARKANA